ncbi:Aste57867_10535 [Aphanomyces stellatus]|uniref:Aste57867_10535 protein n=1 Tax=Aphanomyces stellatus TaxID=120398 RepID=A0A485KQL5_9STRA|nr:hypothetical protein As57867_010495 [Aphanomyces stellatus]VFT87408.1 Aste57867_10535 [Aphanomyces stellatus]
MTTYLQYWIECVACLFHYVAEKVWTPIPTDDRDGSSLLCGGASDLHDEEAAPPEPQTIVILHHGSVDQFCGSPRVQEHGSLVAFCQGHDPLLEYIDGYVGWLTSPRVDNSAVFPIPSSTDDNAHEFMEWLQDPEKGIHEQHTVVATGSDTGRKLATDEVRGKAFVPQPSQRRLSALIAS